MRVPGVATGNTEASFKGYPSLPIDDSGSEVEMEGQSHPAMDDMAAVSAAPSPAERD